MLGHADSKELQSSKGDVNTLPLKKQAGAREELFLLRKCKHVQDRASKSELKCDKTSNMDWHKPVALILANPEKTLAFEAPNRQRV